MKFARFVSVVLFAATTFASAAQSNIVPSASQTFTAGVSAPAAAAVTKFFGALVLYNSGAGNATSVTAADVNGDGKLDLLMTNICSEPTCNGFNSSLSVFLGNGDGTFQAAKATTLAGFFANSLAVTDVNKDGKLDVVVANRCLSGPGCTSGGVDVLLGNGDGTSIRR